MTPTTALTIIVMILVSGGLLINIATWRIVDWLIARNNAWIARMIARDSARIKRRR